jgi:hypothetical protein
VAVGLRLEVRAEPESVVIVRRMGRWELSQRVLDPFAVTSAMVVGRSGRRSVVLVGGRNEELARVYVEQWADPPALATWWADAVASVVEAAASDLAAVEDHRVADPEAHDAIARAPLRE